jgi:predicted transcriptional regulator
MNAAVAVKLNDETKARIKHLATVKQRSAHWLMREALETYLAIEE